MKITNLLLSMFFFQLMATDGYCLIDLVDATIHKDGGTRCLKFIKAGQEIKCCIDGRSQPRKLGPVTNDVFAGYPGDDNSRKMSKQEIQVLYNDINEFMKSPNYINFSKNKFIINTNSGNKILDKKNSKKLRAYSYIESYQKLLSEKLY